MLDDLLCKQLLSRQHLWRSGICQNLCDFLYFFFTILLSIWQVSRAYDHIIVLLFVLLFIYLLIYIQVIGKID